MKRSEAREIVFKIIFQKDFHDDFETIYPRLIEESLVKGVQKEYVVQTLKGILDNFDVINGVIASNLKQDWSMERLPKIAVALLRLGVYELLFSDSIPDITAIDEAVKLAFAYCDSKDATFINGVLHKVYEQKKGKSQ